MTTASSPTPRQTASYLMRRFSEAGLRPVTKYGQNFLIDLNLVDLLADSAQIEPHDVVLEVGTGTGSLTAMLAQRAAAVVTVEVDSHMHQLATETLVDVTNVTMLCLDVLKNKNHFNPLVMETVREQLAVEPGRRFKLVANLPYNIATPVISNLLSTDPVPASMTVTIQKELADRIAAVPSTKDYSALSVWMQSQCDIEIVRIMPPTVFWPRPKVDSAIIHLTINPDKRSRIPDLDYFHAFVRAMFFHRRKFLRSELIGFCKDKLDKPGVDAIMQQLHLRPDARAEQLDVETMLALCAAVRQNVAEVEEIDAEIRTPIN